MSVGESAASTDQWTIGIAGAAFALSVVSLLWQVRRSSFERPIVSVSAAYRVWLDTRILAEGVSVWEVQVTLTNVGERPVTVTDAGADLDFPGGPNRWASTPDTPFPWRLETYGSASMRATYRAGKKGLEPAPTARPWAIVVSRPHFLRKLRGGGTTTRRAGRLAHLIDERPTAITEP